MKPTFVLRDYLIKCKANRGGKHLVPITVVPIRFLPTDPVLDYETIGEPSKYFGDTRAPLEKRGDLVKLADGSDRITRTPHVGKSIQPGRNGVVFVKVRVNVPEWLMFTKRTNNPKLRWVMNACKAAGLRVKLSERSMHAPISWVHRDDHDAAWKILGPIDNVPDDDARFKS